MYLKSAFTIREQINQLKERGLEITDSDNCEHYLNHISYYRLANLYRYHPLLNKTFLKMPIT